MSEPSEWREGVRLRHLLGEQEALALRYLARATKAEADREIMASERDTYQQNATNWEAQCLRAEREVERLRGMLCHCRKCHSAPGESCADGCAALRPTAAKPEETP